MANRVPLAKMLPSAARTKRIRQLAANPATRSAIPDALLPAQYKKGRATAQRMKQENATLYNPSAILSGQGLRDAVKAEVDLQINPQVSALGRGINTLTNQRNVTQARSNQYSQLYNQATQASAGAAQAGAGALLGQVAAQGQNTQNVLQGIQADDASRRAADTALRGEGLQGPDQAAQQLDLAKANAAGATASATNQAAATGGALAGLAGVAAAVAPMRAQDQQFALAGKFNQQIADMTARRAETEATRGPLTTQTLNKMRQDQFTNLATAKGLDIKQSDLQLQGQQQQAQQQNQADKLKLDQQKAVFDQQYKQAQIDIRRGIDPVTHKPLPKNLKPESASAALDRFRLAFLRKHGYLPPTGPPKPAKPKGAPTLTPNEVNTQVGKFTSTVSDFKAGVEGLKTKPSRTLATNEWFRKHPGTNPLALSIAADIVYDGHVSRPNARKLHKLGLTVDDLNLTSYSQFRRRNRGVTPAQSIPGFGGN